MNVLRRPATAIVVLATLAAASTACASTAAQGAPSAVGTPASTSAGSSAGTSTGTSTETRVLGHRGVGRVHIGDSAREARKHGARLTGKPGDLCRPLVLPSSDPDAEPIHGYLARGLGVVALFASGDVRTPEGIGLGSTRKELEKAYPDVSAISDNGYRTVDLAGHRHYQFGMERGRRVFEMLVFDDRQPCFG
ncbi:hypothetical protein GCM10022215_05590 [Nocardioides fonticola]|uniref:Lipoprotein n=1 Tax=Nocardioides fonticola TaxID=450363 RepID=A0ABP7XDW4_9ACTN